MTTSKIVVVGAAVAAFALPACENKSCTALGIIREMHFEAMLPEGLDAGVTTLELCFGSVCDTSRLVKSGDRIVCEDVDSHTPNFPTTCTYATATRTLAFTTNTAYGGHRGEDRLVVTAILPSDGGRTPILTGTVTYEDTTDDAARGACIEAWQGSFTKD